jgi:dihydroorotate dehydrogenase (fumarate)
MVDLTTTYLTLQLRHPFVSGASPLPDQVAAARRLEDGGASAIVIRSLFEEQITMAQTGRIAQMDPSDAEFAKVLAAFPSADRYVFGPDEYLEHVRRLKAALEVPVIASLNGMATTSWIAFARDIEQAGADVLELNMYQLVADPVRSSLAVESDIRDMVATLKRTLRIPLAVKLPIFLTAPCALRHRARPGRRRRVDPVQPRLPAAHRHRHHVAPARAGVIDQCRTPTTPCMAADPARASQRVAGCHRRCPHA